MKRCMGCMCEYDDQFEICPNCGFVEGTMPDEAIHMVPGTIIHDRYIIGRTVGFGGFGVTYVAWDRVLELRVAIKEYLPSEFSTRMPGRPQLTIFNGNKAEQFNDGMKKFLDEARRLAKFQNEPGIVRIYDCFEENATAYIVMEYLEGITLGNYLKEVGSVPEDVAVTMMMPVIKSLRTVHESGIIHRDIAPDNIMITTDNQVKLIDFGAARYATTSHSRSLTVIVKPGYSPEEQYRSRGDQGPHTDVYSLGAVLYKMISGKTPPDAMERRAYFENDHKDILTPLSKGAKISENKENAILNAMNIRIEDRTPDMETLLSELTSTEPVARRDGKIKKIDVLKWPLWTKIAIPATLAALIAVLVLFFTGVIGFDFIGARDIFIPDGMTQVPNVVGQAETTANKTTTDQNLNFVIAGSEANEFIPKGCVMNQDTSWGTVVKVNSKLGVLISEGPTMTEVPYLAGYTMDDAKRLFEEYMIEPSVVYVYDSVIPEGCIISQEVLGGTEKKAGSKVPILVSKGRNPDVNYSFNKSGKMPDLSGMTIDEVREVCETYGILLSVKEYAFSKDLDANKIMDQSIPMGEKIKPNTLVTVIMSKGPMIRKIPLLVNKEIKFAEKKLDEMGVKCDIEMVESETVAEGLVISQSIEEGTVVDENAIVRLVVSSGPPRFDMVDVVGMLSEEAYNKLNNLGLSIDLQYSYSKGAKEDEVLEQTPVAGEKVYKGYPVTLTINSSKGLVEVPDVIGQEEKQAKKSLEDLGFTVEISEVYDSAIKKGTVIEQSLKVGSSQHTGTKITLAVSLGKKPYVVTFNANGGTLNGDDSITVYESDTYGKLPTANKQYANFLGWYTAQDSGKKISESDEVTLNKNIELYAHWEQKMVQISFDGNQGTASQSVMQCGMGENYKLPSAERNFYSFEGWFTSADGGVQVTTATQITNENSHTLYAHWKRKTVTVAYDAGQGKLSGDTSITYKLGEKYNNPSASRAGYTFVGWFTGKDGSGKLINSGDQVVNEGNFTLYASWSNSAYTVSFDSAGGSAVESRAVVYGGTYGSLVSPNRTGYSFVGWFTSSSGGDQVKESTKVTETKNHTLYARWSVNKYVVNFDGNGGTSANKNKSVDYGSTLGSLPSATRDYHNFAGWYTQREGGTKVTDSSVMGSDDITVYAHWDLKPVSDWVCGADKVPTDAQIIDRKWKYTKTEFKTSPVTTSTSYSEAGWTTIGQASKTWKETGSGTIYVGSVPSGFKTDYSIVNLNFTSGTFKSSGTSASESTTSKRTVSTSAEKYVYYHWAINASYGNQDNRIVTDVQMKNGISGKNNYAYIYFFAFASDSTMKSISDDYCCYPNHLQSYSCSSISSWLKSQASSTKNGVYCNRFYRFAYKIQTYKDYQAQFTYNLKKVTYGVESTTEVVNNGSTITDVSGWYRYRPK